jgi:hypothetical protein
VCLDPQEKRDLPPRMKPETALKVVEDGGWVYRKPINAEERVMIQTPSLKRKVKEGRQKHSLREHANSRFG